MSEKPKRLGEHLGGSMYDADAMDKWLKTEVLPVLKTSNERLREWIDENDEYKYVDNCGCSACQDIRSRNTTNALIAQLEET